MFATYSDTFAKEFGAEVRAITQTSAFKQIFPDFAFRSGSKAKDYMVTTKGGRLSFIGRGGSGTGKSADLVVIDDPLKNAEEAESPTVRRKLHEWYSKVIYSRAKSTTAIVVIQTRWHEDDLIGKLCDPEHPDRVKDEKGAISEYDESKRWNYINIPAVVKSYAGSVAKATLTTADVRGTYKPNSATNGSLGFVLIAALLDPNDVGVPQA